MGVGVAVVAARVPGRCFVVFGRGGVGVGGVGGFGPAPADNNSNGDDSDSAITFNLCLTKPMN